MSKQRTEYRDDTTGELIADVQEHVQGHHMGEIVVLPKRGACRIIGIPPVQIERVNNNAADCIAIHIVQVR